MKKVYMILALVALTACGSDKDSAPSPVAGKYTPGNFCQDLGAGLTCGLNSKPSDCNGYIVIDKPFEVNLTTTIMAVENGPRLHLLLSKDGKTASIPYPPLGVLHAEISENKIRILSDFGNKRCVQEFNKAQ
jgi:hypothetical protein